MDIYRKLLVLLYFKTYGKEYDLLELRQLLGLDNSHLDQILMELKSDELIAIEDYIIVITEKGLISLVANNINCNSHVSEDYNYKNINTDNRMALDEPYVPKKFLTKV